MDVRHFFKDIMTNPVDEIDCIRKCMESSATDNVDAILSGLQSLQTITQPMSAARLQNVLKQTGVGKMVNTLRKQTEIGEVKRAAKDLVKNLKND